MRITVHIVAYPCLGRGKASKFEVRVKPWEIREGNHGREQRMKDREASRRKKSVFKGSEEGQCEP